VQLDGEKPDKITRGACACNNDKVIFENPLNWTTRSFIFAKQGESVAGQRINALLHFQERFPDREGHMYDYATDFI
jgi:hypothetical protein